MHNEIKLTLEFVEEGTVNGVWRTWRRRRCQEQDLFLFILSDPKLSLSDLF